MRRAFGIHSYRGDEYDADNDFSGDHDVIVRDVIIDLVGATPAGVIGVQQVEGYLNVAVQDSTIAVDAPKATGLWGVHTSTGDVNIEVRNVGIEVRGPGGIDGIFGYHLGTGDSDVAVRDADIELHGDQYSNGISFGYFWSGSEGNLSIDAQDVDIEVHGERHLDGIWSMHRGTGDIDVDVRRAAVLTNGADSGGMSFVHDGHGDIDVAVQAADIEVHGNRSVGVGAGKRYQGTGDIIIDVRDSTVAATERALPAFGRSIYPVKAVSTCALTAGRSRRTAPAVQGSWSASPAGYSAAGRGRSRLPPVEWLRWTPV